MNPIKEAICVWKNSLSCLDFGKYEERLLFSMNILCNKKFTKSWSLGLFIEILICPSLKTAE